MKNDLNQIHAIETYGGRFFERYLENAPISLALIRAVECMQLAQEEYIRPALDFGSGEGLFTSILFKDSVDIGMDISHTELKASKKKCKYNFLIAGSIDQTCFKNESFNTILSNSVFEHLNDLDRTLQEIYRILKKDGVLIFTTYTAAFTDSLFYGNLLANIGLTKMAELYSVKINQVFNHKKLLSLEDWTRLLDENGFQVLKAEKFLPDKTMKMFGLFLPFSLLNLLCKKFTSKWKLFSTRILPRIAYFWLKSYFCDDTADGCGLKFVVKKT